MKCVKIMALIVVTALSSMACNRQPSGEVSNPTLETILNRKSVRDYSAKEIPEEALNNLLKAAMAAPSSRDRRPWELLVISEKTLLQELGGKLRSASMLQNANKAIIVCGDTTLSDNCWFLDCSAVTQNILLAAESMGIGAVWTAVYPYDDRAAIVREQFQLPGNIEVLAVIPLGYPVGKNTPKDKFDAARIHYNKW
ncbi:MAG: nitroreductase family protein [Prevotellaceae bacterium]|jgi:nitroreductase|nr:nitroreductase family protein [Prevotellaceae bacterium]